jgi:2-keto-4-pentenoate hydratase/2-oxohepta-3-ene-1,7-dioic acid hydratase in catechol pathway
MKLIRFDAGAGPALGVVKGRDAVVDLSAAGPRFEFRTLLESGQSGLDQLATFIERTDPHHALSALRLLAPLRPHKYLAIGMNYRKHAAEAARLGVGELKKQLWFNKQTTCISGPYDDIDPGVCEQLDYEVELGVVIGPRARHVGATDALDHVFGYVVANDVSARDWQFHSPTFTVGKSFDTHGPVGPWIVTADEIKDPQDLSLRCLVNGETRQNSNTAQMIYSIAEQIEYLSTAFTLEPGDLLATGTPEGVGIAMVPPRFLQVGDVVRCEIDGIGVIENRVAPPSPARSNSVSPQRLRDR